MTPAETLWLSGLLVGTALGLPLGIMVDRLFLRPVVRSILALGRADDRRS